MQNEQVKGGQVNADGSRETEARPSKSQSYRDILDELQARIGSDMDAGLPPPLVPVLENAGRRLQEAESLWMEGMAPMPFDAFCLALDKCPLFPRQRQGFEEAGWLDPRAFVQKGHSPVQEMVLCWGKGCLAGDTEITDWSSGRAESITVAECHRLGHSPTLLTLRDGRVTEAHATPFVRLGQADLFRVVMESGAEFSATADHKCASGDGWVSVGEIVPGETRLTMQCGNDGTAESIVAEVYPVGRGAFYDTTVPETGCYFDASGVLHSNSGKDYLCSKLAAYVAYVLLSLRDDPARFFGIAEYSQLSIVNIAPTEKQARTIFFDYLKRFVKTPVMARFIVDKKRQIHADDILFFRTTDEGQEYTPIALWSMHSRAAGLEGKNIIFWVMDEADAFYDAADKSNADELHGILRSSASTRFSGFWKGVVISYPRVEGGFMMRTLEKAKKSANYHWDKAATWDVNLNVQRDSPDIQADYDNDPTHAAALYECIPSATIDAFFEYPEKIDEAVEIGRQPLAYVSYEPLEIALNGGGSRMFIAATVGQITRTPGHAYFLGGDAGEKGDAYTLSVFHTEEGGEGVAYLCPTCGENLIVRQMAPYTRTPFGTRQRQTDDLMCGICLETPFEFFGSMAMDDTVRMDDWWVRSDLKDGGEAGATLSDGRGNVFEVPHVYEDLIVRIKPVKASRPGEVNQLVHFPSVATLCERLVTELDIRQARFDPHMTQEARQRLLDSTGADVDEISFSNPEQYRRARLLKAMLHAGKITLLPDEVRDKEWKRLQRRGGSNRIDHPSGPGEGKDIFDAESIAVWCAATSGCAKLSVTWA